MRITLQQKNFLLNGNPLISHLKEIKYFRKDSNRRSEIEMRLFWCQREPINTIVKPGAVINLIIAEEQDTEVKNVNYLAIEESPLEWQSIDCWLIAISNLKKNTNVNKGSNWYNLKIILSETQCYTEVDWTSEMSEQSARVYHPWNLNFGTMKKPRTYHLNMVY